MKQTIEWHEKGLVNRENSLQREAERLDRELLELGKFRENNMFLSLQVESAKAKGKDGFDSELFMKKQNPRLRVKQ